MTAPTWRFALRGGGFIIVDVCDAYTGTPLAECTTAEQLDYMRATARLHEGAMPETAEAGCIRDGDSAVGHVAAGLLSRGYAIAEIVPPGEMTRDEAIAAAVAAETQRCIDVGQRMREKAGKHWTEAQHTAVAAFQWEMRPVRKAVTT